MAPVNMYMEVAARLQCWGGVSSPYPAVRCGHLILPAADSVEIFQGPSMRVGSLMLVLSNHSSWYATRSCR